MRKSTHANTQKMAHTKTNTRIDSTRTNKPTPVHSVSKAPSKRLRASRKVRSGDIRPDLVMAKERPAMIAQVATVLSQLVQFRNLNRMFDEAGSHKDALSLQIRVYHTMRPDRPISEQAIIEACKLVISREMVPTAKFLSNMPQLTRAGTVLVQPGCTGTRGFTKFASEMPSVDERLVASLGEKERTQCGTPTINDILPLTNYETKGPLTPERAQFMAEERAAFIAACLAPCLLEFKDHMNFLLNPITADWLLPLLDVAFVDVTLPSKSKICLMRRDMTPAIAINGADAASSSMAKTILRDHDCPTYTVSDTSRDGVPTIIVYEAPKPRDAVLTHFREFLVELLRLARTPPDGPPPSFVDVLRTVLQELKLPLPETIVVMPSVASTSVHSEENENEDMDEEPES